MFISITGIAILYLAMNISVSSVIDINSLLEEDKKFIQNYLFARFSALSADEFFKLAKMILRGDAKATSILDRMVKEIVAHLNEVHSDDDEDYDTDEDGDTMGPDDDDLSDLDDFLGSLGIDRS